MSSHCSPQIGVANCEQWYIIFCISFYFPNKLETYDCFDFGFQTLIESHSAATDSLLFKVYMTDFFLFAQLNLPNVLKKFFDSDFPSPCFDVPKASNFTSGGVQNHETKNRRLGTNMTSFQDFKLRKNRFL